MDVHREINNTGNKSPMEDAVNQSIDQLAQQVRILDFFGALIAC